MKADDTHNDTDGCMHSVSRCFWINIPHASQNFHGHWYVHVLIVCLAFFSLMQAWMSIGSWFTCGISSNISWNSAFSSSPWCISSARCVNVSNCVFTALTVSMGLTKSKDMSCLHALSTYFNLASTSFWSAHTCFNWSFNLGFVHFGSGNGAGFNKS